MKNKEFFADFRGFIVVSKASDLIFKIVIFHDVPHRSST